MHLPQKLTAFAVALSLPTGAMAQMSPETWLEELTALYAGQGMNLAYDSQSTSGDALVVSGITLSFESEEAQATISFDEMTIRPTDLAGFDLEVVSSPDYVGKVTATAEGAEIGIDLNVTATGVYYVGGPEGDRKMELSYPEITLTYDIVEGAPEDMPPMDISARIADLTGSFGYSLSAMSQAYDMAVGAIEMTVAMEEADGQAVNMMASYNTVALSGDGPIVDITDNSAMFNAATPSTFNMRSETSALNVAIVQDGAPTNVIANSGPSTVGFNIGNGGIEYVLAGEATTVNVAGAAMPMPPIDASIARYDMRFALPLAPTDDPRETAIRLNFEEIAVDEGLWSMIDPGAAVPRDPATITLDIAAMGKALIDMTSNPEPEAFMAGMPWEFDSVELKQLLVSFGGAAVSGQGEATINNGGFFPMPVGGVDIRLQGVTTLANTLVEIGLLQQGQVMPLQMMLGMFAKPTGDADTFESRVEMTAEGGIIANGVPLQ